MGEWLPGGKNRCSGTTPKDACGDNGEFGGYFEVPLRREIVSYRAGSQFDPNFGRQISILTGTTVADFDYSSGSLSMYFEASQQFVLHEKAPFSIVTQKVATVNTKLGDALLESNGALNRIFMMTAALTAAKTILVGGAVVATGGASLIVVGGLGGFAALVGSVALGAHLQIVLNDHDYEIFQPTHVFDATPPSYVGEFFLSWPTALQAHEATRGGYTIATVDNRGSQHPGVAFVPYEVSSTLGITRENNRMWHMLYRAKDNNDGCGTPDTISFYESSHAQHALVKLDQQIYCDLENEAEMRQDYEDYRQMFNLGVTKPELAKMKQLFTNELSETKLKTFLKSEVCARSYVRAPRRYSHGLDALETIVWMHQLSEYTEELDLASLINNDWWNLKPLTSECYADKCRNAAGTQAPDSDQCDAPNARFERCNVCYKDNDCKSGECIATAEFTEECFNRKGNLNEDSDSGTQQAVKDKDGNVLPWYFCT